MEPLTFEQSWKIAFKDSKSKTKGCILTQSESFVEPKKDPNYLSVIDRDTKLEIKEK